MPENKEAESLLDAVERRAIELFYGDAEQQADYYETLRTALEELVTQPEQVGVFVGELAMRSEMVPFEELCGFLSPEDRPWAEFARDLGWHVLANVTFPRDHPELCAEADRRTAALGL